MGSERHEDRSQGLKPIAYEFSWRISHRYLSSSTLRPKPFLLILKIGLRRKGRNSILVHRFHWAYLLWKRITPCICYNFTCIRFMDSPSDIDFFERPLLNYSKFGTLSREDLVVSDKSLRPVDQFVRERLLIPGTLRSANSVKEQMSKMKGKVPVAAKIYPELPCLFQDPLKPSISRAITMVRSSQFINIAFAKSKAPTKVIRDRAIKSLVVGRVSEQIHGHGGQHVRSSSVLLKAMNVREINYQEMISSLDRRMKPVEADKVNGQTFRYYSQSAVKYTDVREPKYPKMVLSPVLISNPVPEKQASYEERIPVFDRGGPARTSQMLPQDIDKISDRVCAIIERKIKTEKERRGLYV